MAPRYAELRCKSCFSFLEGASQPEELVARAAGLGLSALALADVNGLYGIVRAHAEAKRRGFPLVVGAELAVTGLEMGRPARLVLLARDREGYASLCLLATRSHCPGSDDGWTGAPERREKDEVKVAVENGEITITGERKFEKEEKGKKYHRVERSYGSFVRSFSLPESVDEGGVKAEYKDGVLNLHLPKTEKVKPKAIEVKVG